MIQTPKTLTHKGVRTTPYYASRNGLGADTYLEWTSRVFG
jgi:hypothetical protein